MIAAKIIKFEEESNNFKTRPYYCSEGYPTIGWGFRIPGTNQHDPLPDITMTREEGDKRLSQFIAEYSKSLFGNADTKKSFELCNDDRKAIFISMVHQLGMYGLLKFKNFLAACREQDYAKAAKEMINSTAYKQSPNRWKRQAKVIETGSTEGVYD